MKFSVGQIVYVLLKGKLLPARVAEEHVVSSLNKDTQFKYMLQFSTDKNKLTDVATLEAEIFANEKEASDTLLDRTMITIDKMISNANMFARETFPDAFADDPTLPPKEVHKDSASEEDVTLVELPDGRQARLKMPVEQ